LSAFVRFLTLVEVNEVWGDIYLGFLGDRHDDCGGVRVGLFVFGLVVGG